MKKIISIILIMGILFCGGCQVEQKSVMGANSNREEGFSGYGVARVRGLEGPLMDLVVPDRAPKGLTDPVHSLRHEGQYTTNKRILSTKRGERVLNNRPNVLRDKYAHRDKPYLQRKSYQAQTEQTAQGERLRRIEQRIEALEHIEDAHVLAEDDQIIIGIESYEQDRKKLIKSVENEIRDEIGGSTVYITTNRRLINQMNAIEHHVSWPHPFEGVGGTVGELADLIDDTIQGRR
ncbi:YhcN/YlaJ family sporulation lipoprotein [Alkalihalobacillus oceani]|uniref:YhcN/YlaJ family sporulation lipoprotein n=1 Tax=Halalkalibacter oceani TaxID=1653776 RepID=A0A9X2DNP0_9BACI|nr:YhcN/YlaJ family sporulation lipoprotein [Halalkalibacter oceani]MCM3713507.1 YhcN/YlaJ family sporulation lipoprotein [Halalkalibacter oceani]